MKPAAALQAALVLLGAGAAAAVTPWFLSADGAWNYSAYPSPLTWDDAEAACVRGGGHLMHMDSQAEWEYVNPRAWNIWRTNFPGVDPSWGAPGCMFLHAGYRTPNLDTQWETVAGMPLPASGVLAPWNEPWATCNGGCPRGREPNDPEGRRCALFSIDFSGSCHQDQFDAATFFALDDCAYGGEWDWCQARRRFFCKTAMAGAGGLWPFSVSWGVCSGAAPQTSLAASPPCPPSFRRSCIANR